MTYFYSETFVWQGINWWSGVDYCDVFISCLDTHSDGTHSLQRIHWWVSDVMLHFSRSLPMKKQTHPHLGWPKGEYIFSKFSFLGEYSCKTWKIFKYSPCNNFLTYVFGFWCWRVSGMYCVCIYACMFINESLLLKWFDVTLLRKQLSIN